MDIKEQLNEMKGNLSAFMAEVRQKFSAEPVQEPASAAFGEVTLVDGTVVVFEGEEPAVGVALNVKGVDGVTPAPDGVHETESGLLITTKDGVIESIEPKEMEEPDDDGTPAEFASLEQFDALRAENEAIRNEVAELKNTMISILGKVEETFSVFDKFASQTPEPAEKPFGFRKVEKQDALKGFASAFKNIQTN
jgi:FtsZ-binding cell division protein ZapB